jgi:hypothetical protein
VVREKQEDRSEDRTLQEQEKLAQDPGFVRTWGAVVLRPYPAKRNAPASEGGRYTGTGDWSGSIAGVDADVFRGEIAGPVAGGRPAAVQIHNEQDVRLQQTVAGGAFVEIQRLAAA